MAHCCKYTKGKEETFVFVSNSNQHDCRGKKVNHQLRLVPETVTSLYEISCKYAKCWVDEYGVLAVSLTAIIIVTITVITNEESELNVIK